MREPLQAFRRPQNRKVLCGRPNFSFSEGKIVARVNRAELGDFDALVLGLLLVNQAQGQLVIPDLGFYGRDFHSRLIREKRLIAGVSYLDELPERAPHRRQGGERHDRP
jgi:hypothetical protein